MSLFWHYTTIEKLFLILEDGYIKTADAFVDTSRVKPAVWFSANQDWEHTANKMMVSPDGRLVTLTRRQMIEIAGLVRFGVAVETVPYDWEGYKKFSGESRRVIKGLEITARRVMAIPDKQWRVSFEPVTVDEWLAVQVWNPRLDRWQDFMEWVREVEEFAKQQEKELALAP